MKVLLIVFLGISLAGCSGFGTANSSGLDDDQKNQFATGRFMLQVLDHKKGDPEIPGYNVPQASTSYKPNSTDSKISGKKVGVSQPNT